MFGLRARAAFMLYAGATFFGSVMLVLVWQTPVGRAIEEATGIRPAFIGSTISTFAGSVLPGIGPAAAPAPAPGAGGGLGAAVAAPWG